VAVSHGTGVADAVSGGEVCPSVLKVGVGISAHGPIADGTTYGQKRKEEKTTLLQIVNCV